MSRVQHVGNVACACSGATTTATIVAAAARPAGGQAPDQMHGGWDQKARCAEFSDGDYSSQNRYNSDLTVIASFMEQHDRMGVVLKEDIMELGAFSVSLSVNDIQAFRDFYAKLGFEQVGGNVDENWLILRNGNHVIGLFQGMFERNMLTFNPGWDQGGKEVKTFTDVRKIQQELKERGIPIANEADETTHGPASFMITDPDGNPILIDQHR